MSPLLSDAFALAEKAFTSQPRVLFTFTIGTRMWRYAQAARDVTVPTSGLVYTAAKIQVDGDVERKEEIGAQRIPVKLGIRTDVVAALRAAGTEQKFVGIHRWHPTAGGLPVRWAYGEIASVRVVRGWCVVELQTDEAAWDQEVPRAIFAPQCQWSTYGPECGVNADEFAFATTITALDRNALTVASVDSHADGYYALGILKLGANVFHIASQVGTTLRMFDQLPSDLALPAAVTLYAGDDLTHETCRDKFKNLDRFLGFKWLPSKNPLDDVEHRGPDVLVAGYALPDPISYTTPAKFAWYRPDRQNIADPTGPSLSCASLDANGNVMIWSDSSGHGRDMGQPVALDRPGGPVGSNPQPIPFVETGFVGFGGGWSFGGSSGLGLNLPDLSSLTAAEILFNIQADADPPATNALGAFALMHAEGFGGGGSYLPNASRMIVEGAGIVFRIAGPWVFPAPVPLNKPNTIYSLSIAPERYTVRVNGVVAFTTTPGDNPYTVLFNAIAPFLGGGWRGRIKRVLIYAGVLGNTDRDAAIAYMISGSGSPP